MTSNPPHHNDSPEPARHLEDLDQLLIDAEVDDEVVQQAPPVVVRPWRRSWRGDSAPSGWCWASC